MRKLQAAWRVPGHVSEPYQSLHSRSGSQQALLHARSDFLTISSRYYSLPPKLQERARSQLRGSSPRVWVGANHSTFLGDAATPSPTKTPDVGAANRKVRLESRSHEKSRDPLYIVFIFESQNLGIVQRQQRRFLMLLGRNYLQKIGVKSSTSTVYLFFLFWLTTWPRKILVPQLGSNSCHQQ